MDQLRTLGRQVDVIVYSDDEAARSGTGDPVSVARRGLDEARRLGRDVLIVDTAGRLAIDAEMMDQVRRISEAVEPNYTFLVVDAMTGQDAVTVAEAFHETLELDGVILSKLDGGMAVRRCPSREVIGRCHIRHGREDGRLRPVPPRPHGGTDPRHGRRALADRAGQGVPKDQAEECLLASEGQFTFDDFLDQMRQVQKMGSLSSLVAMMPGVPKELKNVNIDDGELKQVEAIICSMTADERRQPGSSTRPSPTYRQRQRHHDR